MRPILFEVGPVIVWSYGFFYLLGLIVAFFLLRKYMLQLGMSEDDPYWIFGVTVAMALVGGKLLGFYMDPEKNPFTLSNFLFRGGYWQGGVIAGFIGIVIVVFLRHYSLPKVLDASAVAVAGGHATGRIGCFLTGCCWGSPTNLPWGVTYTDILAHENVGTPLKTRVHPAQLYESFLEYMLLTLLIYLMRTRLAGTGAIMGAYLIGYGVIRFFLEFLRGTPRSLIVGPLDLQHIISIAMIVGGILLYMIPLKKVGVLHG
jgi:phosphatidylglycerol---prolipoprotein diacylglyceryl transferase